MGLFDLHEKSHPVAKARILGTPGAARAQFFKRMKFNGLTMILFADPERLFLRFVVIG